MRKLLFLSLLAISSVTFGQTTTAEKLKINTVTVNPTTDEVLVRNPTTKEVGYVSKAALSTIPTITQVLTSGNIMNGTYAAAQMELQSSGNIGTYTSGLVQFQNAANSFLSSVNADGFNAQNTTGTRLARLRMSDGFMLRTNPSGGTAWLMADNVTAFRSLQFPDASGTLALQSDIPATPSFSQVLAAGNTNTNTGLHFSLSGLNATTSFYSYGIQLAHATSGNNSTFNGAGFSNFNTDTREVRLNVSDGLSLRTNAAASGGSAGRIKATNITGGTKDFELPNKSGTIALTSDLDQRFVLQSADEISNTTTSFVNITGLGVTLAAGYYDIEFYPIYSVDATTTGTLFSFNGNGTIATFAISGDYGSTGTANYYRDYPTVNTGTPTIQSARVNDNVARVRIKLKLTSAGTFYPTFVSEVSTGTVTVKEGSSLIIRKLMQKTKSK